MAYVVQPLPVITATVGMSVKGGQPIVISGPHTVSNKAHTDPITRIWSVANGAEPGGGGGGTVPTTGQIWPRGNW